MVDIEERLRSLEEWRHEQGILSSNNCHAIKRNTEQIKEHGGYFKRLVWIVVSSNIGAWLLFVYSGGIADK